MPVKIETFEPFSDAEFDALRQKPGSTTDRTTDRAMVALLAEVKTGQPMRVPLAQGQSARGMRTAISRAAGSRGINVETVTGDGFVAVRKIDQPRVRRSPSTP